MQTIKDATWKNAKSTDSFFGTWLNSIFPEFLLLGQEIYTYQFLSQNGLVFAR
jgi:hypothetical protein